MRSEPRKRPRAFAMCTAARRRPGRPQPPRARRGCGPRRPAGLSRLRGGLPARAAHSTNDRLRTPGAGTDSGKATLPRPGPSRRRSLGVPLPTPDSGARSPPTADPGPTSRRTGWQARRAQVRRKVGEREGLRLARALRGPLSRRARLGSLRRTSALRRSGSKGASPRTERRGGATRAPSCTWQRSRPFRGLVGPRRTVARATPDPLAAGREDLFRQAQEVRHAGRGDAVVDAASPRLPLDEAALPQARQVHRCVGLGEAGRVHDFGDAPGPGA